MDYHLCFLSFLLMTLNTFTDIDKNVFLTTLNSDITDSQGTTRYEECNTIDIFIAIFQYYRNIENDSSGVKTFVLSFCNLCEF